MNNVEQLIQTNPLLAFVAIFIAGVGVSFTPCVYPVIPMTLGYIGARAGGSRWKGFTLSLVYVLGMAMTYAVLGAFAALTGRLFGQLSSSHWTFFIVGNVCLLLSLSMFGVFELPQLHLGGRDAHHHAHHAKQKHGNYIGAFFVGVVSGLIVGPCTAPVLAAVLVYVGSKQNVLYGFSLLFAFGYGVGFLLILLGTFTGLVSSLPKSGHWLKQVKHIFGWLLLIAAQVLLIKAGSVWR